MRTTLELSEAHRASLLAIAARRGEKGFSQVVAEAVEAYLAAGGGADRAGALRLKGVLSDKEAAALRGRVKAIRRRWR
jgi:hypothetical protein